MMTIVEASSEVLKYLDKIWGSLSSSGSFLFSVCYFSFIFALVILQQLRVNLPTFVNIYSFHISKPPFVLLPIAMFHERTKRMLT